MKLVSVVQVGLEPEWFRLESNERVMYRGHQMRSSARLCSRCGTAGLED